MPKAPVIEFKLLIEPDPGRQSLIATFGEDRVVSTGAPHQFFVDADEALRLNGTLLRWAEQEYKYEYITPLKNDQERKAYFEKTFVNYWWEAYTREVEGGIYFTIIALRDKQEIVDEIKSDLAEKWGHLTEAGSHKQSVPPETVNCFVTDCLNPSFGDLEETIWSKIRRAIITRSLNPSFEDLEETRDFDLKIYERTNVEWEPAQDLVNHGGEENVAKVKELIRRYPDFHIPYYFLAAHYKKHDDLTAARMVLNKGLTRCRKKSDLCYSYGGVELAASRLDEAVKWWIHAAVLQLRPGRYESYGILMYQHAPFMNLAYVAKYAGQQKEADKLFAVTDLIVAVGKPLWITLNIFLEVEDLIEGVIPWLFNSDEINLLVRRSNTTLVKSAISALVELLEQKQRSPEYQLLLEFQSLNQKQNKQQLTRWEEVHLINEHERLWRLDQQLRGRK